MNTKEPCGHWDHWSCIKEKKMTPFKFTPEMFYGLGNAREREYVAKDANMLLSQWLKSAVKVYGCAERHGSGTIWSSNQSDDDKILDTHSALLIGITELEKKVCEHKGVKLVSSSFLLDGFYCNDCDKKLKATWQEI